MSKDLAEQRASGELGDDPLEGTVAVAGPEPPPPPPGHQRIADIVSRLSDMVDRRASGEEHPVPVPWVEYGNALRGGFWPGLHVLAAGTGAGKTAFAIALARHALRQGHPVGYVTLELEPEQVAARMATAGTNIPWSDFYYGQLKNPEANWEVLTRELRELEQLPLTVVEGGGGATRWTVADGLPRLVKSLREEASSLQEDRRTPLVILDYLQLLGAGDVELRQAIGEIAYHARYAARTEGVAVLCISSVARDKYQLLAMNATKEAGLRGAGEVANPDALVGVGKESGEVEFAADTLTVITKAEDGSRRIVVPKQRGGAPTWFEMGFRGGAWVARPQGGGY